MRKYLVMRKYLGLLVLLFFLGNCSREGVDLPLPSPKGHVEAGHSIRLKIWPEFLKQTGALKQDLNSIRDPDKQDIAYYWVAVFRWEKFPDIPAFIHASNSNESRIEGRWMSQRELINGFRVYFESFELNRLWFQKISKLTTLSRHNKLGKVTGKEFAAAYDVKEFKGSIQVGVRFVRPSDVLSHDDGVSSIGSYAENLRKVLDKTKGWIWTKKIPLSFVPVKHNLFYAKSPVKEYELDQVDWALIACQVDGKVSPLSSYPKTYKEGSKQKLSLLSFQEPRKPMSVTISSSIPGALTFPKGTTWTVDSKKKESFNHPFVTTKKLLGKMTIVTLRSEGQSCAFPVWGDGYKR